VQADDLPSVKGLQSEALESGIAVFAHQLQVSIHNLGEFGGPRVHIRVILRGGLVTLALVLSFDPGGFQPRPQQVITSHLY
jgi:hypothetical protein